MCTECTHKVSEGFDQEYVSLILQCQFDSTEKKNGGAAMYQMPFVILIASDSPLIFFNFNTHQILHKKINSLQN